MLEEAEKKEITGFVVIIFIVGGILIGEGGQLMMVIDTVGSFIHIFRCN